MKIAIIGAGNMGGAIARGLARGKKISSSHIFVSNRGNAKLEALKAEFPELKVTTNNKEAAQSADVVVLAVKPWLVEGVLKQLDLDAERQILVSVAAGIPFTQYVEWVGKEMTTRWRN